MCASVCTLVHVYNILILYAHYHDNNKQYERSVHSMEQVCF